MFAPPTEAVPHTPLSGTVMVTPNDEGGGGEEEEEE